MRALGSDLRERSSRIRIETMYFEAQTTEGLNLRERSSIIRIETTTFDQAMQYCKT